MKVTTTVVVGNVDYSTTTLKHASTSINSSVKHAIIMATRKNTAVNGEAPAM